MKQMREKFVDKNKSLFVAYIDLGKEYDTVDVEAIWRVLGMYRINGQWLKLFPFFAMSPVTTVELFNPPL